MKTAYLFPGAGIPLYKGVNQFAERHCEHIEPRMRQASETLGVDFSRFLQNHDDFDLSDMTSQLFFYAFSGAMVDVLRRLRPAPEYVTGYSMGMFSAMYAAGVIGFADGLVMLQKLDALVTANYHAVSSAMAVITGLTEEELADCREADAREAITVINQNAETSFIISGTAKSVDMVIARAKSAGALTSKLPLTLPYHTDLLLSIKEEWRTLLDRYRFSNPDIPIVCSQTQLLISDAAGARDLIYTNIYTPFSWYKTIKTLESLGVTRFIECGPSITLSNIGKIIDASHEYHNQKTFMVEATA